MEVLQASKSGLLKIRKAREQKQRAVDCSTWLREASRIINPNWQPHPDKDYYPEGISHGTWKRFLSGKTRINAAAFKAYCQVLELDWEEVVDTDSGDANPNDGWVGRKDLLTKLGQMLRGNCRLLLLTGITGIGKTALAEKLISELQQDYPNFFRISFEEKEQAINFSGMALEVITGLQGISLPAGREQSNPEQLLQHVMSYLCTHPCLLLLDSLEYLLEGDEQTGWSNFQDASWLKFFQTLLTVDSCQSKVLITSQEMPAQLEQLGMNYKPLWACKTLQGFTEAEQLKLFKNAGLAINGDLETAHYLSRIGAAYEGHPLALRVIVGEIADQPFWGDVVSYWQEYGNEITEIEQAQQQTAVESAEDNFRLDRCSRKLRKLVKWRIEKTLGRLARDVPNAYLLLCRSSVYRHPVTKEFWLSCLQIRGLNQDQQDIALDTLYDRYLVEELRSEGKRVLLRQHNLIRSTASEHLELEKLR